MPYRYLEKAIITFIIIILFSLQYTGPISRGGCTLSKMTLLEFEITRHSLISFDVEKESRLTHTVFVMVIRIDGSNVATNRVNYVYCFNTRVVDGDWRVIGYDQRELT